MKTQNISILSRALALAALGLSLSPIQQVKGAGFVEVSPMKNGRNDHTATLLPNGKVLIAGGYNPGAPCCAGNSAELYDPATDTWTVTGSLRVARAFHHATLLPNGKVLVVGGTGDRRSELYDPATGKWALSGPMKRARSGPMALLPNGKVLVVGGAGDGSSELYDPTSGAWTATGSAISDGHVMLTLLPNGKVLAGANDGAELYDPATGTWTTTASASGYDYNTATLLLNGKVLAAGGNRTFTAELYDPDRGTWSATGSMTWDRAFCTATLLRNGQVLVTGGYQQETDTPMSSAELYDPATGTWTEIAMNYAHFDHTATLLPNGKVLVAGGFRLLSSAELYEPDEPFLTLLRNADQTLSLSWSGTGTLEQTASLAPPNWQPAPSQANPQTNSTTEATKFFRVKTQ